MLTTRTTDKYSQSPSPFQPEGADDGSRQKKGLLRECVRAQEKLRQLVRDHDDHGTYATLAQSRAPRTVASGRSPDPPPYSGDGGASVGGGAAPSEHSPVPASPMGPPPSPMADPGFEMGEVRRLSLVCPDCSPRMRARLPPVACCPTAAD